LRMRNNAATNKQQQQQMAKTMTRGVTTSDAAPDVDDSSTDLGIAVDDPVEGTRAVVPAVGDTPVLEATDEVASTAPVVVGMDDVATGADTPVVGVAAVVGGAVVAGAVVVRTCVVVGGAVVAGAVVVGGAVVAGAVVAGAVVAGAVVAGAVVGMPVVVGTPVVVPVVAGERHPTAASSQTRSTALVAVFVESNPPAK
jgi:hypothetical protein